MTQLTGVSAANLINLIVRGLYRLPTAPAQATAIQTSDTPEVRANQGRVVIYSNRVIRTYLDLQAMNKTNVLLRLEEYNGKVVTTFRGIPIRTCDAIGRELMRNGRVMRYTAPDDFAGRVVGQPPLSADALLPDPLCGRTGDA